MPRRVKDLPDDRADYTFGDLVYWHLFIFGTRPDCDPSAKICRPWDPQTFCALVDISDRTLWNWVFDRHLPDNLLPVEAELFGHNPQLHDWRIELARALRAGRLQRTSEARFGVESPTEAGEDDGQSAQSGIEDELPAEDAGDVELRLPARYSVEEQEKHDGPVLDLPALRRERERAKDEHESRGGPIDLVILQREYRGERGHASARPGTNRRRAVFAFLVPGMMLLLGVYGWTRPSPVPGLKEVVAVPPPAGPGVKPPPDSAEKKPPARPSTDQEKREAEERRIKEQTIDAMKAASDAEKRARDEEAIRRDQEELAASRAYDDREFNRRQLAGMGYRLRPNTSASGTSIGLDVAESINDCGLKCLSRGDCDGFAYYRAQKVSGSKPVRSCYFFKRPIDWISQPSYDGGEKTANHSEGPASPLPEAQPVRLELAQASSSQVEANGVIQCSGEPVKVTGFRLFCDKLIVGGSALGSTQLRYSVSNINECATKCRAVSQCGGFAYKSMAYRDKHDCEIMGPTKNMNNGGGWISGLR